MSTPRSVRQCAQSWRYHRPHCFRCRDHSAPLRLNRSFSSSPPPIASRVARLPQKSVWTEFTPLSNQYQSINLGQVRRTASGMCITCVIVHCASERSYTDNPGCHTCCHADLFFFFHHYVKLSALSSAVQRSS